MSDQTEREITTRCCIVGGGPAGMMLGLLLARAGVQVCVLEKHGDFLRDFRGDTVHPSTLEVLAEIGLKEEFDRLPQQRVEQLKACFADGMHPVVDFRGIRPFPYAALVPQWDFLDFLADKARVHPNFALHMSSEVEELVREDNRVAGVRARTANGPLRVRADLVVACDGRHSVLRAQSGLRAIDLGAPMDVLWFRLPRLHSDVLDSFGIAGRGHFIALLQRGDYWQIGYVIPKGSGAALQRQPIDTFRAEIAQRAAFLSERTSALSSWQDVKLLEVHVNCLTRWFAPGLLLIGDAAHAMSPIGGVGINLAIQDAVAAANVLVPALKKPLAPSTTTLARVQLRRMVPTELVQLVQLALQRALIAPALRAHDDGRPVKLPAPLRGLLALHAVRAVPARIFGLGVRREHVTAITA